MSKHLIRNMNIAVASACVTYVGWVVLARQFASAPHPRPAAAYRDFFGLDKLQGVKILQFYAASGSVREGEALVLCYGVANARSVRLEPGFGELSASLNRCVSASPDQDTSYTLTVTGSDGKTVSASVHVEVKPEPALHPAITFFRAGRAVDDRGRSVRTICYAANNADRVEIEPPVFPPNRAPKGCFYVAPLEPTTYTLTVTGPKGRKVSRQVTVSPSGAPWVSPGQA